MHSQHHQRALKPTKEFLTTQAVVMQRDDRRHSPSQVNLRKQTFFCSCGYIHPYIYISFVAI